VIRTVAADMDSVVRIEDLSQEFDKVVERVIGTVGVAYTAIGSDRLEGISRIERQVDACARAYVAGRCDRSLWLQVLDDYERSWLVAADLASVDAPVTQTMAA